MLLLWCPPPEPEQAIHPTLLHLSHVLPANPPSIKRRCPRTALKPPRSVCTPAAAAASCEPGRNPRAEVSQLSSLQTANFSSFQCCAVMSGSTVTHTSAEVTHQRDGEMRCVLQMAKEVVIGGKNQFSQSFPLDGLLAGN